MMGGLSCAVPHNAIMAGAILPVQPTNASDPQYVSACNAFDEKMRKVYAQSDVVQGIVDADLAPQACALLAKSWWSTQDRATLWRYLLTLWPQAGWGP